MNEISPRQFAELCKATYKLHEASWFKDPPDDVRAGEYTKSWQDCANQACTELGLPSEWAWIAQFLIWIGYTDVWEWCERQGVKLD